jgi:hypothetical protein
MEVSQDVVLCDASVQYMFCDAKDFATLIIDFSSVRRPYNAPPNGVYALSMVMSIRLDTCMEALRSLARSSELEANRLPTAELRIRDFLMPVGTNRAAQRAALEELDNAVSREAELRPREASFWQAISDFIAQRLAMLNFD